MDIAMMLLGVVLFIIGLIIGIKSDPYDFASLYAEKGGEIIEVEWVKKPP